MDTDSKISDGNVLELTADIVASYLSNNSVGAADVPAVISSVHAALRRLTTPVAEEPEPLKPPVPIRKTITPDYLISLEDGKRYKSLKRHLAGRGLTPQEYREKWGLPADYPMVAPSYSAQRSALAKQLGLGQSRQKAAAAPAKAPSKTRQTKTRRKTA